ncbi:hypothetical protein RhiirA4_421188 [Rhizophagus irregularis]|uniref:Ricin B lectin domain-containing protein n=1 Tax=Rhizophagus irregularis TaxID=588596 RepID=A0A2I1GKM0_9GLOM|nr:hypothetical protein RhiirA4_421188 [Rhizophagus irregularis]
MSEEKIIYYVIISDIQRRMTINTFLGMAVRWSVKMVNGQVDTQLWYFNGGYITNKRSGLVLSIAESAQIIQHEKYVPSAAQEWDYDYKDNTISLKANRKFVLDVTVNILLKLFYLKY